ncbi:MAG: PilN domain-containing protein [Kiritimatiellia bacterium]
MTKPDVIALMVSDNALYGVRYSPRGSAGLTRTGGGVWSLAEQAPAPDALEVLPEVEDVEETPLMRAVKAAKRELGGREVVLAFPLSRLLVRILKLPVAMRDDLAEAVHLQMDKISPFDEGGYSTGYEVLSEAEDNLWVLAAAMPSAAFDAVNGPLTEVGWKVVRTDIGILGWLRHLCGPFKLGSPGRRVVLVHFHEDWMLMVMNHGTLVLARSFKNISSYDALVRELTLSVLNVEIDAGPLAIVELLVVAEERPDEQLFTKLHALLGVNPEFKEFPSLDGGVMGVALRSVEQGVIDLTPPYWKLTLREGAVRRRIILAAAAAGIIWLLLMGALFSGPIVYKQLTKAVTSKSKAHYAQYKSVADTRKRVNLILSYTNREYSPLEMLRVVSGYLPQGITLTGFNFKKGDGIRISGDADQPTLVYQFKDAVTADPLFETVTLTGPSASRDKHKFEVNAVFKGGDEL